MRWRPISQRRERDPAATFARRGPDATAYRSPMHVARPRFCVYCGSASARPAYAEAAPSWARASAERGVDLVYGGGDVGLMGVVADADVRRPGRDRRDHRAPHGP